MARNKLLQSNETFHAKRTSKIQQHSHLNYQSLFLWINFLWGLIALGMVGQRMAAQAQGLPATLDLASLMANQGMVIQGAVASDLTGTSVASAGDVNGDGITDLVVGAWHASPLSRPYGGVAYFIYGSRTMPAVLDLSTTLAAAQGMVIQGAMVDYFTGYSVASAGDVNGDNISDVVVGAYRASPLNRTQAGAAYVIYGSRTLPAMLDLNTLSATQGMVIQGAMMGGVLGWSVSSTGDVNGDGISDLVIGAFLASPSNRTQPGAAYVIYGSRTLRDVLDLNTLTQAQGMVIQGAATNDSAGISVSSAGDINGDGISDVMVGAHVASPLGRTHAGTAYVIYGSRTLPAVLDLNTTLTQAQGMVIQGAVSGNLLGWSGSSAGDVNGDNITDLVIGAYLASPLSRLSAGAAYLIYGSRTLPAVLDLNITLTHAQGMVIQGAVVRDTVGTSVSGAGDVNGDGISDLLVGAGNASPLGRSHAGAAYVIYGSRTLPPVLDLNTTLIETQGMVIQGAAANDTAGNSVRGAGDVNGDGISDLVVGAGYASPLNRTNAGAAYLIYGKAAFNKTTQVATSTLSTAVTTTISSPSPIISSSTIVSTMSRTTNSSTASSTSMTGLLTTAVNGTPTQNTKAGSSSGGNTGTVIGAAAGASVFGLAACLGAVGFYAYRKKSKANKAELNKTDVAMQDKDRVSEQQNRVVSQQSNYGKIDENKKTENEYDRPTKLEI
jgi:hypothetical protein